MTENVVPRDDYKQKKWISFENRAHIISYITCKETSFGFDISTSLKNYLEI